VAVGFTVAVAEIAGETVGATLGAGETAAGLFVAGTALGLVATLLEHPQSSEPRTIMTEIKALTFFMIKPPKLVHCYYGQNASQLLILYLIFFTSVLQKYF